MPTGPFRRNFSEAGRQGFISPLLLALIAVLLIGGGAYVYGQKKQINQPVVAQTADWKTYTNAKYKFEFKYPSNATVEEYAHEWVRTNEFDPEESDRGVTLTTGDIKMTLSINEVLGNGEVPAKFILRESKTLGQITVAKSVKFEYQGLPSTWVLSYYFENQGDRYKFSTEKDGTEKINPIPKSIEDLMEQVLSTLKFTK